MMEALIQLIKIGRMIMRDNPHTWSFHGFKTYPIRYFGILLLILLRTFFASFWLLAGINKVKNEWISSDILKEIFLQRLTELPPDSLAVLYLSNFAIPFYKMIAYIVTVGELYSAIGLLIGLTTKWSAIMSLFILLNFAIGGYYDASLIPFFILVFLFVKFPTFFSKLIPSQAAHHSDHLRE